MKPTKYYSLLFLVCMMLALCFYGKGEMNLNIEISMPDENLVALASKEYNEAEMSKIVGFEGSLIELNAKYPVECLRENDGIYRASYLGDECVAILLFDSSGNKIMGNIYCAQLFKSDFGEMLKGKSLDEVRMLDPNGEYLFLYTGRNDTPKVSSHCTKDGYLIVIKYDFLNTVIDISETLI